MKSLPHTNAPPSNLHLGGNSVRVRDRLVR